MILLYGILWIFAFAYILFISNENIIFLIIVLFFFLFITTILFLFLRNKKLLREVIKGRTHKIDLDTLRSKFKDNIEEFSKILEQKEEYIIISKQKINELQDKLNEKQKAEQSLIYSYEEKIINFQENINKLEKQINEVSNSKINTSTENNQDTEKIKHSLNECDELNEKLALLNKENNELKFEKETLNKLIEGYKKTIENEQHFRNEIINLFKKK